jgi:hypothetical protein
MGSRPGGERYCRCGTRLALDNSGLQCGRCERVSRGKFIAPPDLPAEFWLTEELRDACERQHIGEIARAYRLHPHHLPTYGPGGISQQLLGQWIGLSQAQVSRIETGPALKHLDILAHWARVLRIPPELLWFKLPGGRCQLETGQLPSPIDPECDPILTAPWSHPGTVEASLTLRGGEGQVRRRRFLLLAGAALTAPAHQWLIHEPGPVASGLSGGRISKSLADRLPGMVAELRRMDDVAGGGSVLSLAKHHFGWVSGLLDQASYDERTGRMLHLALAELGLTAGWAARDAGEEALAQHYYIAALRAAHTADDRALGAHILASMAKQAAHSGRPTEAVTLAQTALAGSQGRQTPRLLAELYVREAYAFGTLGDVSSCTAAVSKAHTQLERLEEDEDLPWLYWVIPAWVLAEAGDCLLQLNRADQAVAMLDEGIALFDESFARDRVIYLAHLADALARPGEQCDLEAAATRGIEAIQLAESLHSTISVGLLQNLHHQMMPHANLPAVEGFLERAAAVAAV